ncbi:hypothetical protein H8959_003523 [Pygathrix nigripes]
MQDEFSKYPEGKMAMCLSYVSFSVNQLQPSTAFSSRQDKTRIQLLSTPRIGCQIPKPEVIFSLEQEEPCMLDGEISGQSRPGEKGTKNMADSMTQLYLYWERLCTTLHNFAVSLI